MFSIFRLAGRVDAMDKSVAESFLKVRQDTQMLQQWVTYLYDQNKQLIDQNINFRRQVDEQKISLSELKAAIVHIPKPHTSEQIKQIIDAHYSLEPVFQRLKLIEQKIDLVDRRRLADLRASSEENEPLKERLMKKLVRNSKEYIKNLVLSLVHKYGKIGALQLREIVVEEQGLCSKSSFYRILEEMEEEQKLQVVSDGKLAVYVVHPSSVEH